MAPLLTPATCVGLSRNLPCRPWPDESSEIPPALSSNFQWASRVPAVVAPRALSASPDAAHNTKPVISANAAARSALYGEAVNLGERILQRVQIADPRIDPITF